MTGKVNPMATQTPHTTTKPDGFEQMLGPASRRYFGSGFRRTRYEIVSPRVGDLGDTHTSAVGRVYYARDWSTKAEAGNLTPHISTVDAAVLATKMMEVTLAATGLTAAQVGGAWIESLTIRAGARPLESLVSVPLATDLIGQLPRGSHVSSIFESRIGSLAIISRIRHARPAGPARIPDKVNMSGPLTTFYRSTRHHTQLAELDTVRETIRCHHEVHPGVGGKVGLESEFWPAVTLIDCLVLAGQMAQGLIYAVEQVDRAETSNLWMRRASFEASAPADRPTSSDATLRVVDRMTTNRGDRCLNGVTVEVPDLFGVRVTAALAYFGSSRMSAG